MDYPLAKEQAVLALLVQEGRRELEALKVEREAFIKERVKETTDRIHAALEASREAVRETQEYAEVFQVMNKEAERLLEELREAKAQAQKDRREFRKQSEEARKALDEKTAELESFAHEVSLKKMQLDGEVEQIRLQKISLQDEQRKTDDKRKMLAIAIKVLKEKGLWKLNETGIELQPN